MSRATWEVVCADADGNRTFERVPATPAELAELHRDSNGSLVAVGLPPRPPGFRWFQRLPDGRTARDVAEAVNRALSEATAVAHPAEEVPIVWRVVRELRHHRYARPCPAAYPRAAGRGRLGRSSGERVTLPGTAATDRPALATVVGCPTSRGGPCPWWPVCSRWSER